MKQRATNLKKRILIITVTLFVFSYFIQSQTNFSINYLSNEDSLKSLRYLSSQISRVLSAGNLTNTSYEVAVYSLDNKKYYFKKDIDDMLTPASITKIFTCYSSLLLLNRDYNYKTKIYYTGTLNNNILNGDIYLVGDGDPFLSSIDISEFAKRIKDIGIVQINGNIIADGSSFDKILNRVEYSGDKEIVQALQPISGLSVEQNIVSIIVDGTIQRNSRLPLVRTNPPSSAFLINNTARVVGRNPGKSGKRTGQIIEGIKEEYGGPLTISNSERKTINITQQKSKGDVQIFNISGSIDAGDSYSYSYYIENPELVSAGTMMYFLKSFGISVNGIIKTGKISTVLANAKEISSKERPLVDIISTTLKNSDNYLAESIFKKIGSNSGKLYENAKEAKLVISELLVKNNIVCSDCELNDGSGLSRRNKINGKTVIGFLTSIYNTNLRKIVDTTLSVAGVDGTLKNRMNGTLAQGNLIAKTGTHKNVSGLCGFVKTLDGENLAFSFIFNGYNVSEYKRIENQLGIVLSEFFYFNKEQ